MPIAGKYKQDHNQNRKKVEKLLGSLFILQIIKRTSFFIISICTVESHIEFLCNLVSCLPLQHSIPQQTSKCKHAVAHLHRHVQSEQHSSNRKIKYPQIEVNFGPKTT